MSRRPFSGPVSGVALVSVLLAHAGVARGHGDTPSVQSITFPALLQGRPLLLSDTQGVFATFDDGLRWLCEDAVANNAGLSSVLMGPGPRDLVLAADDGVYLSDDGGCSFRPAAGLPAAPVPYGLWPNPLRSSDVLTALAVAGETVHTRFYLSVDHGRTFEPGESEVPGLLHGILRAAHDPQLVYAVGRDGFVRSDDGGRTFAPIEPTVGGAPLETASLYLLGDRPGTTELWATSQHAAGSRLLKTTDLGVTWTLMAEIPDFVDSLAFDADGRRGTLATLSSQMVRTPDGGERWLPLENGPGPGFGCLVRGPDGALYACADPFQGAGFAMARSPDFGDTWEPGLSALHAVTVRWDCPAGTPAATACADLCPGRPVGATCTLCPANGACASTPDAAGPGPDASVSTDARAAVDAPLESDAGLVPATPSAGAGGGGCAVAGAPPSASGASGVFVALLLTGLVGRRRRVATPSRRTADRRPRRRWFAALLFGTAVGACETNEVDAPSAPQRNLADARPAAFEAHGSVGQIWLVGAVPGEPLELTDPDGRVLRSAVADSEGSLLLRDLAPGLFRVISGGASDRPAATPPLRVTDWEDHPEPSYYAAQRITPGYGYLAMRDGTRLALNAWLPGPPEKGPYPTLVEYSGYEAANPDAQQATTAIAALLGYAVVAVNMRGTGCSGGVYDFFEPLQSTDGYDIVESVAAQPWVKGHKVGMIGASYPGISQLFVAQLDPPSLAAISPLSVISDPVRGVLRPGGIFNDGFATWIRERQTHATVGGQPWSRARLDAGDEICRDNMRLRGFTRDIFDTLDALPSQGVDAVEALAPFAFVDRIRVPVFLAGAWQDEAVGSTFAHMIDRFEVANAHFTMTNGGHGESMISLIMGRWMEFLRLYVDDTIPHNGGRESVLMNGIAYTVFGTRNPPKEPDRFAGITRLDEARAVFEADPRVRILFENGAGGTPGHTFPTFEAGFDAWPIPGTRATAFWLDAEGRLAAAPPTDAGRDTYTYDPSRAQVVTLPEGGTGWEPTPPWVWEAPASGAARAYETDPLTATLVMAGTGSADLWLTSTALDTDVQVTLSEVRPDGLETYVQSGWLRGSARTLDAALTTDLRPVHAGLGDDAPALSAAEPALLRVQIPPFAHVFRSGSRVRLVVAAPGGDKSQWKFDALPADGHTENTLHRTTEHPSKVVLPVVPGVEGVPETLPPCPSLRFQPCRPYAPL
jgi:predicted acyl esterase